MYTTRILIFVNNVGIIIIICMFSYILTVLHNCLNLSCYVGPYTGGFSCNCNLARLLVTGAAIGVVANSLLKCGEFGGFVIWILRRRIRILPPGISTFPGIWGFQSNCNGSSSTACVSTNHGSRLSPVAIGRDCISTFSSRVSVSSCLVFGLG
jgi:hypothetical protein